MSYRIWRFLYRLADQLERGYTVRIHMPWGRQVGNYLCLLADTRFND